jgi:tRNA (guanine-N7-)-methyltransferase
MFYGRRHGRRLRPRQVNFLEEGMSRFGLSQDLPTDDGSITPISFFDHAPEDIFLEIGFGGGEHLAFCAAEHPEAGYIGAEPFMNGVASLCRHLIENRSENIRIWPEDVRLLLPSFAPESFAGIFVLFPDPWPKHRHRERRIIQQPMLDELYRLIRPQGTLLLASDEPTAKTWMLSQMMRRHDFRWLAKSQADWKSPPENWSGTRYKAKADREGRPSSWFVFKKVT